jgi:hypothetical protein
MLDAGEALPHTLFSSAADSTAYDDSNRLVERYSGRRVGVRNTHRYRRRSGIRARCDDDHRKGSSAGTPVLRQICHVGPPQAVR